MRLIDADKLKKVLNEIFDTVEVLLFDDIIKTIDNAPTIEERPKYDVLNKIPKDFVYDTETSEFYCYRNKYTGEEIHIIKSPKTYMLADEIGQRPKGKWIEEGQETGALGIKYTWVKCSECGWSNSLVIPKNYCPNCGADMRGGK